MTDRIKVGQQFSGKPKHITLARLVAFSGGSLSDPSFPRKSIVTATGPGEGEP